MNPLGPDTRSLLAAARGARPTPAAKARVDARLAATLGVAAVAVSVPVVVAPVATAVPLATAAPLATAVPLSAAPLAAPLAAVPMVAAPTAAIGGAAFGIKGVILAAALVVGTGAVVVRSVVPSDPAPSSPSATPSVRVDAVVDRVASANLPPPRVRGSAEPVATASSAPPTPSAESAEPSSSMALNHTAPRAGTSSPATPKASTSNGPLRRESAVITQALRSLREGDADAALRAIDGLGSAQPTGPLAEERLAARVLALCAAGRTEDAKAAAADFLSRFPTSVQANQVRASCAR